MKNTVRKCLLLFVFCFATHTMMGQEGNKINMESPIHFIEDTTIISKDIITTGKIRQADSAIPIFRSLLARSVNSNYSLGSIKSLFELGRYYSNKGTYDTAIALEMQIYKYCINRSAYNRYVPILFYNIANVYYKKGLYEKSQLLQYQALNQYERLKVDWPQMKAAIYLGIAANLAVINKGSQQVLYYDKKAEQLALAIKDTGVIAHVNESLGSYYYLNQKFDSGRYYYLKTLQATSQPGPASVAAMNLSLLAEKEGNPNEALQYATTALALSKQTNVSNEIYNAYSAMGKAYYELKDYTNAKRYLLFALQSATKIEQNENVMFIHKYLTDLYEQTHEYNAALTHAKIYIGLKDSLQGERVSKAFNELEVKYQVAQKDEEIAKKQLELTRQELMVKEKNNWIVGSSFFIIGLCGFFILLYRNRQKLQKEKIRNLQQEKEMAQLKAMMQGEEKERSRIGQELHDGIGGMLTAAKMNLNAIQERHQDIPQMKNLNEINNILNEAAIEVRKTAHNLMPDVLSKYGLAEALQLYCEQINTGQRLQIDLQFYWLPDQWMTALGLPIYRIIQELIQNIVKHSQASLAEIQVRRYEEIVSITVEDNGTGFDTKAGNKGLGLQNIHSRVQALNGELSIESIKDKGTIVRIKLELQNLKMLLPHAADTYSHS